jgi:hypothetical protein
MPPRRSRGWRQPRGAQKWVLAELRALKPGDRLSTSQIAKRVRKAAQKSFHPNSLYNALRIPVRRGAIDSERDGHEKLYRAPGPERAREKAGSLARSAAPVAPAGPGSAETDPSGAQLS